MRIDVNQLTCDTDLVGKSFWICDYRQPNIDQKPIRHLKPTLAVLTSNSEITNRKTVYYSANHFRPLTAKGKPSSTIIGIFDNTGYRSFTGVPIAVFDNEQECIDFYNAQADTIIEEISQKIAVIQEQLIQQRNSVIANKV